MRKRTGRFSPTITTLATAYDDQGGELVIPESFDGMETSAIEELHSTAVEQFNALYAEAGSNPTAEQLASLGALTEGIEALAAEVTERNEAAAARAAEADAFAQRVGAFSANTDADADDEDADEDADNGVAEGDDTEEDEEGEATDDESAAQTITASGSRREIRVALSNVKRKNPQPPAAQAADMTSVAFSTSEGTSFARGQGMTMLDIGKAIDSKLSGVNVASFKSARRTGNHLSERNSIVQFRRNFADGLMIDSTDNEAIEAAFAMAVDQSRLPQGGLIASGGWCSPSETMYDLLELESRDGMVSLPEVGINRGGIRYTPGPSFGEIFSSITGFSFSEEDDIDGKYEPSANGNVVGAKPCYHVECPDFIDERLHVDGVCITAGLLMNRGYPEVIARTVRGAMVAHDHRVDAGIINKMVAGSTAVNMGSQVGVAAPVLDSVEKQATHYRYTHRLPDNTVLEAVFPIWALGAFRSDLSRRLGVDLLAVTDEMIKGWLRTRKIAPQFVYNWQAIDTTAAGAFTAWPNTLSFMLYAAGTWVRGSSDVITLDTLYDSTLLSQNDYTALFTEEGWLVAKRGHDSRVVTLGIEASGGTHMGVDITHQGTLAPALAIPGATEAAPLFTQAVGA